MIKSSRIIATSLFAVLFGLVPSVSFAQSTLNGETAFILNTFMFLMAGTLVMWMAAGFSMLEAGLVRAQNTATICLKNVALYAIAGLMFYLIGYNLMYADVPEGGFIGTFKIFYNPSVEELALMAAEDGEEAREAAAVYNAASYSRMSDWFFQMVFVATAASIVSGTVAERIKLWPFLIFVAVLTAFIYPIQGAWSWGQGWLYKIGFSDFAGSTSGMIDYVKKNQPKKVMMVTECSMSDNIQVENPNVEFIRPCNMCPHMKKITLPKILDCLENETGEIIMDKETINKARLSVEKMVAIGR